MLKIYPVKTDEDIEQVRSLFQEYTDYLKQVLSGYLTLPWFIDYLKGFEKELTTLPGEYSPPTGCLLLAKYKGQPVGCVALKKLSSDICKGKRLYVRPKFRGLKIGKKLMESIIVEAQRIGYSRMQGDTVHSMQIAQVLHTSLGFKEINPNHNDPIKEAKFIELKLK